MSTRHDLAAILKASGMTQTALAEHIGVDPSVVSHYIAGRRSPSFSRFRLMREALGVAANVLSDALWAAQQNRARRNGGRSVQKGSAA